MINLTTITPASLKAKEVATQDYVDTSLDSIDLSGYTTSQEVADAIANDTTTIDGSRITTGTIDAAKIDTQDLVVQHVSDGLLDPVFEVSAPKVAGPTGDKNYHIYGADMYGARFKGGIIEASYIQNSIPFDTFTEYTGCSGYPSGWPILQNFNTPGSASANETLIPWSTTPLVGTYSSNTLGYTSCEDTTYKLKNSSEPLVNIGAIPTQYYMLQQYNGYPNKGYLPAYNHQAIGTFIIHAYSSRNISHVGGPSAVFSGVSLSGNIGDTLIAMTNSELLDGLVLSDAYFYGEDMHYEKWGNVVAIDNRVSIVIAVHIGWGSSLSRMDFFSTSCSITVSLAITGSSDYATDMTSGADVVSLEFKAAGNIKPADYYNDMRMGMYMSNIQFSVEN